MLRQFQICTIASLSIFLFFPVLTFAQSGQSLSVTPPLFQLSVNPGDVWQSSVKIVNVNDTELVVFAEVVNFEPVGEHGQGKFNPILNETEKTGTLAEWIEVANGPYIIPPQQSKEISFFVDVPDDASPGGHFAAILIGTQPPRDSKNKLIVQVSQAVTSLFFVRIEGDVNEAGGIREFKMKDGFVPEPHAEFLLRFENKGNVHLQPRGDIIITNMWGKERGVIPINHLTHFGNVLPNSIREFDFSWKGESSITEIGRYKAIVTLAYGENGIKSTSAITYFWVLPVKGTLITLGLLTLFIWFISWSIKLYIRKMLTLAGVGMEEKFNTRITDSYDKNSKANVTIPTYRKIGAPLITGLSELIGRLKSVNRILDVIKTLFEFFSQYKIFFGSVFVIAVGFIIAVLFIVDASKETKNFEITVESGGEEEIITSEEIIREQLEQAVPDVRCRIVN